MVESDVKNGKTTEDSTEVALTELEKKIIRQIEYYFGDFNLAKDKFLQEKIKEDDGWVSLTTLLTFNRLSNLSKESKDIIDALEKSSTSLIEIHDSKEKIRRSPHVPLPEMNEARRKELMERTVYCKGFPLDSKLNDLLEFFYKFGEIDNVAMRSWHDKATKEWKFKGSVFVLFKQVKGAEEFLKIESVKYNDAELVKMWQKNHIDEKRKERLEYRMSKHKKSKDQDNKKDNDDNKGESKGSDDEGDEEGVEEEENDGFATGTVVELTGLDSTIKWDTIKERIEEMGLPVAFIEYTTGNEVAFVRLTDKDSAPKLAKLVAEEDNKLKVGNKELSLRVVEGEEEATFLEKQKAAMIKKRIAVQKKRGMNKKGRGGRGKFRGKWENKKRRGNSPTGQPPRKMKQRADDD